MPKLTSSTFMDKNKHSCKIQSFAWWKMRDNKHDS